MADPVFGSVSWADIWLHHFGNGWIPTPLLIDDQGSRSLAPLMRRVGEVTFLGGWDVTDSFECIVPPDVGAGFYEDVLDRLEPCDWRRIDLHGLRPASPTLAHLPDVARGRGLRVSTEVEETSPAIDLPDEWDVFVEQLSKKERHELRRKFRRLYQAGDVACRLVGGVEALPAAVERFLHLHRISRHDKTEFMTPQMEAFFRDVVDHFYATGQLKLYELLVDGIAVSSVVCFDHSETLWLYNSGFDPDYASLSVGLLLKALCIQEAIVAGRKRFDFLRGREPYKYDLGAEDVPLTRLVVERT